MKMWVNTWYCREILTCCRCANIIPVCIAVVAPPHGQQFIAAMPDTTSSAGRYLVQGGDINWDLRGHGVAKTAPGKPEFQGQPRIEVSICILLRPRVVTVSYQVGCPVQTKQDILIYYTLLWSTIPLYCSDSAASYIPYAIILFRWCSIEYSYYNQRE